MFAEFCVNCSLHGIHYLVTRGITLAERIMWGVLLGMVTVMLLFKVYIYWTLMYEGPVLAFIENPHFDTNLVDFPAVTICPNSKATKTKVQEIAKTYMVGKENFSAFENSIIALSLMRNPFHYLPQDFVKSVNQNIYPIPNENIFHIMEDVGVDVKDVVDRCVWKAENYDCKNLFRRQITQEGFCFSFNSKSAERSKDDPKYLPPTEMPDGSLVSWASSMFGNGAGLEFRLKSMNHLTLDNDVLGDGYSVVVHNPGVVPDMSEIMTIVPNNPFKLYFMFVSINILEVDNSLENLAESERGCTFSNSQSGGRRRCLLDCKASTLLQYCQCIPYYLSSFRSEPICGLQDLQCLSDVSPRLQNTRVSPDFPGFPEWSLPLTMNCSCPQPCGYISYTTHLDPISLPVEEEEGHWTRVKVGYKHFAVKYSRTVKYLFRDFLVGCGSLAGLLLGFSAVALFDLIAIQVHHRIPHRTEEGIAMCVHSLVISCIVDTCITLAKVTGFHLLNKKHTYMGGLALVEFHGNLKGKI
ncbi:hypothetical protein J6590_022240 [Homalodisca vitripennis]|nr:hypothetical protein J6590_022240 [Homalodisca vitripennis]